MTQMIVNPQFHVGCEILHISFIHVALREMKKWLLSCYLDQPGQITWAPIWLFFSYLNESIYLFKLIKASFQLHYIGLYQSGIGFSARHQTL
jgi:hypothetical protein